MTLAPAIDILAQAKFRPEFIWDNRHIFLDGVWLTIRIALVAFALATVLGLAVALLRMSKSRIVSPIIAAYVNVFRAIPLLVFVLFVYYGVAIHFDFSISAIQAGVLALTLQYSRPGWARYSAAGSRPWRTGSGRPPCRWAWAVPRRSSAW